MSAHDGKWELPESVKRTLRTYLQSFLGLLLIALGAGHWLTVVPPLDSLLVIVETAAWTAAVAIMPAVISLLHNTGEDAGAIPKVLK